MLIGKGCDGRITLKPSKLRYLLLQRYLCKQLEMLCVDRRLRTLRKLFEFWISFWGSMHQSCKSCHTIDKKHVNIYSRVVKWSWEFPINIVQCRGCLLVRQSYFHNDARNFADVGGGVLGCRGFHSSFRTTQGGLSLNIGIFCCYTFIHSRLFLFVKKQYMWSCCMTNLFSF